MRTLEVTTAKVCPVACHKYCPQDLFQKRYGNEPPLLSFANFKKALANTPKNVRIDFSGFAEPFVNREAPKMVQYTYQEGYPTCVYSTLVGLTHKTVEPLLDLKYAEFVVHLPDSEGIAHINITPKYLDVLLSVKENLENTLFMCMSSKAHPKIRQYFPQTFHFVDNLRAGNVEGSNPPYIANPTCVKLETPQFVMLPNCDIVLCCMDYGLQHKLGNLLTDTYTYLERHMQKSYDLCHICSWATTKTRRIFLRQHAKNILRKMKLLGVARKVKSFGAEKNCFSLPDFKGIHKGKRCFVIGAGPSLNKTNMKKLKHEITIGCNRGYLGFKKWGIRFKYWGIEDQLVAVDTANEWNSIYFEKKFIPLDLTHLVTKRKNVYPINFKREPFYPGRPKFSFDESIIYWGGTVIYMLLQIAAIMGCNPIYLIGVDFNYVIPENAKRHSGYLISQGEDVNHFDPEYFGRGKKWNFPRLHIMKKGYEAAAEETRKRGIKIYNATVDTKLDVFERKNFDELFQ